MRRLGLLLSAVLVATILGVTQGAQAGPQADGEDAKIGPDAVASARAGEPIDVVVMLESTLPPTGDVNALRAEADRAQRQARQGLSGGGGASVIRDFETIPAFTARVSSVEALRELAAQPNIRRIDVDNVGGTGQLANTVPIIGADDLQADGLDGTGTTVAVIDSGYDSDHPDLAGSVVHEACFGFMLSSPGPGFCHNGGQRQVGPGAAEDDAGHGTHTTGIITSDGVVSSVGVAPGAEIVSLKVLDDCSFSGCFYEFSELTASLDYVLAHPELGVDTVNMSVASILSFADDCDNDTAFFMAAAAAVNNLRAAGVATFASSGNDGVTTSMSAPACLSGVISVGASDTSDAVASFSNTSTTTDLLAPGVDVVSDAIGGGTTTANGTSMASPAAAGCAALLLEAVPSASPAGIETALETTGTSIMRGGSSFPRINCADAAQALGSPPSAPTVSIGDATIVEGDGTKARAIKFAVTLSERSTTPIAVMWDAGGGTATEGLKQLSGVDYKGPKAPKTLNFKPGNASGLTPARKYVSIPVYPDTIAEPTETFEVTLLGVTGGYSLGDSSAIGTILDDEGADGVVASIGDASVHEGDDGKRTAGLVVTLSDRVNEEVLIDYTISGTTATCGAKEGPGIDCRDYGGITKTVRFKPSANTGLTPASKTLGLTVWPDGANEGDEVVTVTLSNPRPTNGASALDLGILRWTGTALLIDDD